jgi:SAM-dependent methyltransferase
MEMALKASVSKWGKSDWKWVAVALVAILCTGLLTGWLLQRYDETLGFRQEADRIAEVLGVKPGMVVGDVRAGSGRWSVDLARRVGDEGHVYATAGPTPVHVLFETVADAAVDNVTVITRTPGDTGRLPVACCDAVLLRIVYHDFENRLTFVNTLYRDVKPGGLLAIIDFNEGTDEYASGHGIAIPDAIEEITSAGFQLESTIEDWEGSAYCLIFRKPVTSPPATPPS